MARWRRRTRAWRQLRVRVLDVFVPAIHTLARAWPHLGEVEGFRELADDLDAQRRGLKVSLEEELH